MFESSKHSTGNKLWHQQLQLQCISEKLTVSLKYLKIKSLYSSILVRIFKVLVFFFKYNIILSSDAIMNWEKLCTLELWELYPGT